LLLEGNERFVFGAAICPGGDKAGGQLDIGDRYLPRQHESDHYGNSGRGFASAAFPPPDVSFAGAEPLGGEAMLDSEGGEYRNSVVTAARRRRCWGPSML